MRRIHQFSVHPEIPERLSGLEELALNLRWTWDRRSYKVFQHLDPEMMEKCAGNPVLLLRRISKERLEHAASDAAFLTHLDAAVDDLRRYMCEPGWFRLRHPERADLCVAYFCMEYGLTSCLPIYSGGLGVLAGDHLKAASGLDVPLVAVGLLYSRGYFTQRLNGEGWQREEYRAQDFSTLPIRPVMVEVRGECCGDSVAASSAAATSLKVSIDIEGRTVWAKVWRVQVGRIPLYLLDTALPENDAAAQRITSELYGGGTEERLAQEVVLGVGGMRVLKALGIVPQICHLNEGHAVFAGLERMSQLMESAGLTFLEARQVAGAGTLFTTHTPVSAGFDLFSEQLIDRYLGSYLQRLGLNTAQFMRMGRINQDDPHEQFNVAILALRQSPRRNAVSRLHRRVTARMMKPGWVDFPMGDIPIESITNGVHTKTWVASEMEQLFDHYLGPRWREDTSPREAWQRGERIPDLELWRTHARLRERLVAYAREQAEVQTRDRRSAGGAGSGTHRPLRPDALTVGFARRFATYKRGMLLFSDVGRLKALLLDESRPVQLVIAGKAHPRDGAGKEYIRGILDTVTREGLGDRVVFLEDYDLRKAAMMVQGVDVWLNTPRRPHEACGTSGMKVVPNGGLNLSVLDGWWAEAHRPGMGWAIGDGQEYVHEGYQDELDAESLYSLLEHEIVPLFFDRDADGLPRGWIAMMKDSIRTLAPAFSADRMLKQYVERFYLPSGDHYKRLEADGYSLAKDLAAWKVRVRQAWRGVSISGVEERGPSNVAVGQGIEILVNVKLGTLEPEEVVVEVYHSRLRPDGTLSNGHGAPLDWVAFEKGEHLYQGMVPTRASGLHGYSVRVLPSREDVLVPHELPLITWEDTEG